MHNVEEVVRRFASVTAQPGSIGLLMLCLFGFVTAAQAETIGIVALGASNTVGRAGTSYPAELEAMLRAKGYDVQITNAGVNGDTTAGMLARVDSAVPNGTRLVLISPATPNDSKAGIRGQQAGYVAQITSRLRARNIKAIVLPPFRSLAKRSASDPQHYDAEGYRRIAAGILPRVMAAISPPGR